MGFEGPKLVRRTYTIHLSARIPSVEHITNLIVAGAAHVVFARVHRKRLHIHRGLYPQRPIQTPTYKVQRFNHRGRHESEQCRP